MHGLINRSLENFVRDTYGIELWDSVMQELDLGYESFEPMFRYDNAVTRAVTLAVAARLDRTCEDLLEDFGTYLVADARSERVRRLLRFGGVDYLDFLHSLDDLPGRAHLAVPDLDLPDLELVDRGAGEFALRVSHSEGGFGHVLLGALRALADDYGALALLEYEGRDGINATLSIRLLDAAFHEGKNFDLAAGAGA
ncbi:heme NO-binding domain-containing protein [Aliiroseovarius subalbicans]|uniref:heme NO-binding domain-containing protein n=1 Tax=Aliiroseovarius subalbicans TaxID=2925840 RepID=UPI001F57AF2A|nr:heme NO-binding domain-containing protein [Aliiroseovarius subalbicans]MCI2398598.1 heme NO-binding domain-containing protein [Aliiroseovarius subalbicans]